MQPVHTSRISGIAELVPGVTEGRRGDRALRGQGSSDIWICFLDVCLTVNLGLLRRSQSRFPSLKASIGVPGEGETGKAGARAGGRAASLILC